MKGSELPVDFARIPSTHAKAAVLASVPGTSEARDTVVAAQVPQTATVDRKKANFTATYDGEPKFKHIEGTDMSYAENSPNDIIKARGKYYAVENGVWLAHIQTARTSKARGTDMAGFTASLYCPDPSVNVPYASGRYEPI